MFFGFDVILLLVFLCGILMSGLTLYLLAFVLLKRIPVTDAFFIPVPLFLALFSFALLFAFQEISDYITVLTARMALIGLFFSLTGWVLFITAYIKRSPYFRVFHLVLVVCTCIISLFFLLIPHNTDLIVIEIGTPLLDPGIDLTLGCFFNPMCAIFISYIILLLAIPSGLLWIYYHRATMQGKHHIIPVCIASILPFFYLLLFFLTESFVCILAAPVISTGIVLVTWYQLVHHKPVHELFHASEHLFHHINAGIIILNDQMMVTNMNPAAEGMFALSLPSVYGKHIKCLLPDVDLISETNPSENIISRASNGEEHSFSYECISLPKQYFLKKTAESGYIVILHDISRQIVAEADLRENLEFLQHLILTIPIPLFFTDKENCFRGCNPAFCSFFFLPEDMILKQPINDIIQPITNKELHETVINRLLEAGGVEDYEISLNVNGTVFDILMTVAGYTDSKKTKPGLIGAFLDITEIHLYQEALETTNKKLHTLSSITRHDILNQISTLVLSVEIIKESEAYETNPDIKTFINKIEVLGSMIHKEILFSRDYEEMGIKNPVWIVVSEIIRHLKTEKLFEQLKITDSTGNLRIYVDPLFERVLYNLFENAIRHGGCVTTIDVSFSVRDDNKGILVVSDNGKGVPDTMKKKIFLKGVGSNTGLGLFLTKEILAITNIEITETGTEGNGARFEIVIPKGRFLKDS